MPGPGASTSGGVTPPLQVGSPACERPSSRVGTHSKIIVAARDLFVTQGLRRDHLRWPAVGAHRSGGQPSFGSHQLVAVGVEGEDLVQADNAQDAGDMSRDGSECDVRLGRASVVMGDDHRGDPA